MLDRTTRELTENINDLLSVLSTFWHTGVNHDFRHNFKEEDDEDHMMSDVMSKIQYPVLIRSVWISDSIMRR